MRRILICYLMLILLALSAASAENLTPLVCTGDSKIIYTVQDGKALMKNIIAAQGQSSLSEKDLLLIRDNVMNSLIEQAAMELKYAELGLTEIDPEEAIQLEENTHAAYEKAVSEMADQLIEVYGGNKEDALVTARALLKQTGLTYETIRGQTQAQWRTLRLAEKVAGDIEVSENEIDTLYEDEYVKPDQEKYMENIPAFENEVIFGGGHSCYIPEGYRLVEWIMVPFPETIGEAIVSAFDEADKAYETVSEAYLATYGTFENNDALVKAQTAYTNALEAYSRSSDVLAQLEDEALLASQNVIDEILGRYESGTSWDDLIHEYSSDLDSEGNPYPLHTESITSNQLLIKAGFSISEPGGTADPVVTEDGILLVCWTSAAESGIVPLDDNSRKELRNLLLSRKREDKIRSLIPLWETQFGIESFPERLSVSEYLEERH